MNKSDHIIHLIKREVVAFLLQYDLTVAEHQRILLECFLSASFHIGISAPQLEQIFEESLRDYERIRHPKRHD
jgi:hypothetical protein